MFCRVGKFNFPTYTAAFWEPCVRVCSMYPTNIGVASGTLSVATLVAT